MEVPAGEVLILDANTLVAEIGLTSRDGSALKHYLYSRGCDWSCRKWLRKNANGT